jgi:outer membrane protein
LRGFRSKLIGQWLGSRVIAVAAATGVFAPNAALADTLPWALTQAYQNNPQIAAQRAAVRATDETVPTALSGYRPRVSGNASVTEQYLDTTSRGSTLLSPNATSKGSVTVYSYGTTVSQTLFNGFQTANRTRQAESQVSAARETLRLTEQNILLAAATAYMNLLRDTAILDLQRKNVEVLQEQLRQVRDRFNVGEVTRTDVAQSESRLAAGRSSMLTAESNLNTSRSTYRQVIGVEAGRLAPGTPVDRLSPGTLSVAVQEARARHPSVTTAMFNIDAALLQVKIAEGSLYPSLSLVGSAQKTYGSTSSLNTLETLSAAIRQAKETLGQRRLDLDNARDQVQQTVVQAWGLLAAAKAQIEATQAQVDAAEIALNGVREEARVGQRTTLDVLNAQQELVNARVAVVTAQRDRVVASYTLLAAAGRLSPQVLGLNVPIYDPAVHYHQVRDSWAGVRTPDGK